jgi:hypothetical protein
MTYNLGQLAAAVCIGFALGVLFCAEYARRRRNELAARILLGTRREPGEALQDTINRLRATPNKNAAELHLLRKVDEFERRAATWKKKGDA